MRRLLSRLGNPHKKLKSVHVAGTKGKGSTVAVIAHALRAAGQRVGVYTSPHLTHIGERVAVLQPGEGSPLKGVNTASAQGTLHPGEFEALARSHEQAIRAAVADENGTLSHFEAVTALAFRHFADADVDIAVVETGLGGLTDATNVIEPEQLQCAVITSIGMDHAAALGGTLESIASAKAGILKAGRPATLAHQEHPAAAAVLATRATDLGCPVVHAGDAVSVAHESFQLDGAGQDAAAGSVAPLALRELVSVRGAADGPAAGLALRRVPSALVGVHQHANIAAAVSALVTLRAGAWDVPDAAIAAGVASAWLPCRFEARRLRGGQLGTAPWYVVLDGAHTREAADALTATLRAVFPRAAVAMVVAMAEDKDVAGVLGALRRGGADVHTVVFTSVPIAGGGARSASPGVLAAQWQADAVLHPGKAGSPRVRQLIQASLGAALDKARHELSAHAHDRPGVIVVTGSLHAAAAAGRVLLAHEQGA